MAVNFLNYNTMYCKKIIIQKFMLKELVNSISLADQIQ